MNIKRLERIVAKFLISSVYEFSKILPIKNQITFATFRTTNLTGNFKHIKEEVEKRDLNIKFNYMFKKFRPTLFGKAYYLLHMIHVGYTMATSKYFIVDDYYFPVYVVKPRKGTKIIQVWHACGAFKKFGYDVLDKEYGASESYVKDVKIHSNYDAVVVSSREVVKHYASAFNMDASKIYPIGIPRTDVFFSKDAINKGRQKVFKEFPMLKGKRVILYAPTFRGKGQTDVHFDMTLDLKQVSEGLNEDTIFALKMHPFVKTRFNEELSNIVDLSSYENVNELLMMADVLVTDYSSVVFEFSLMEKPIIMYAPDKDQYMKERDFYYEYNSFVPGKIVEDTESLIKELNSKEFDIRKVQEFKHKYFDDRNGSATKKFVDQFICDK